MPSSIAETKRFCNRWLAKAEQYDERSLDGAFDRFFSAFVAFNRLYSHVNQHKDRPVEGDKKKATSRFASVIGADHLWGALRADGRENDMLTLANLIVPGGGFYLISLRSEDQPDLEGDKKLVDDLRGEDPRGKIEALLEYLYQVRCNMFHGDKDFDHRQLELLRPATRCLECVVRAGLGTL